MPPLVLIHGYRAASCKYYHLIAPITEHFKLILIDWVGSGLSSRPNNFEKGFSPEEAMGYFVHYIEEWRK